MDRGRSNQLVGIRSKARYNRCMRTYVSTTAYDGNSIGVATFIVGMLVSAIVNKLANTTKSYRYLFGFNNVACIDGITDNVVGVQKAQFYIIGAGSITF